MKKSIFSLVLIAVLAVLLAGCDKQTTVQPVTTTITEVPTTTTLSPEEQKALSDTNKKSLEKAALKQVASSSDTAISATLSVNIVFDGSHTHIVEIDTKDEFDIKASLEVTATLELDTDNLTAYLGLEIKPLSFESTSENVAPAKKILDTLFDTDTTKAGYEGSASGYVYFKDECVYIHGSKEFGLLVYLLMNSTTTEEGLAKAAVESNYVVNLKHIYAPEEIPADASEKAKASIEKNNAKKAASLKKIEDALAAIKGQTLSTVYAKYSPALVNAGIITEDQTIDEAKLIEFIAINRYPVEVSDDASADASVDANAERRAKLIAFATAIDQFLEEKLVFSASSSESGVTYSVSFTSENLFAEQLTVGEEKLDLYTISKGNISAQSTLAISGSVSVSFDAAGKLIQVETKGTVKAHIEEWETPESSVQETSAADTTTVVTTEPAPVHETDTDVLSSFKVSLLVAYKTSFVLDEKVVFTELSFEQIQFVETVIKTVIGRIFQ